jgi:RNA recognition motif-containing protein
MSQKKLYVGNLSFQCTEAELREAFSAHGQVASVALVMDRDTGRPRGFAFVEMDSDQAAQAAIQALDGHDLGGRTIRVNVARPREDRGGGGGGGGGYGGRGGGGGGYGGGGGGRRGGY